MDGLVRQSAALATQKMLEWPRLCSHVAKFASTTLGRKAVLELKVSNFWYCAPLLLQIPGLRYLAQANRMVCW